MLLYNNGKITKQLSFYFLRNHYWKWAASLHRKCSTWAPDTSSNQIYWRQQRCGEREESPRNGFLVSSLSSLPSPAGSGVAGCASWLCYKLDNRAPQTPGNAVGFSPPLLWNTPSLMWRWRELCPWKKRTITWEISPKIANHARQLIIATHYSHLCFSVLTSSLFHLCLSHGGNLYCSKWDRDKFDSKGFWVRNPTTEQVFSSGSALLFFLNPHCFNFLTPSWKWIWKRVLSWYWNI